MRIACVPGVVAYLKHGASRRDFLKAMASASTTAVVVSMAGPARAFARSAADDGSADTIFRGGAILTMIDGKPRAEAIAIRGDRILAVGSLHDVEAKTSANARVIDLDGRTLLPGLIDPHMHAAFIAIDDWVDVGALTTPTFDEVISKVKQAVSQAKSGEWVRAKLFDPSITKGARAPTQAELDALAPNNPFFMFESNGHVAYANSVAMKIAGVSRDTADPPQARYVRDGNGDLTGRIEETNAMLPFIAKMPQPSAQEMVSRLKRLMASAAAVGCTSLHDCGIGLQSAQGDLALLNAVMADNPPVRYRGMLVATEMDQWEKMGLKPGHGDDLFRITGIKAWCDGSNQAYSGYQRENYLGKDTRGAANYSLAELTDAIRRAHEGGWQVGVHANGDAAVDMTIEAYQTVLNETPRAGHRHRIEHCSILHPDQITKMKALGLSPTFLIGHVRWWGKAFRDRILGPERAKFYDPCASALSGGLRISLHSDWNVTPIEPLRYVSDAAARVMNEGGGVFFEEERIPVEAALKAVTLDAAWQCQMDDQVGSLEPGKLADLTILEQDPTKVAADEIRNIKVNATWMNGQQRHGL